MAVKKVPTAGTRKPRIKKAKKQTFVALVIDRSGSMHSVEAAALNGINEQIHLFKSQGELGGETFVSFIQFDDEIEVVFDKLPSNKLVEITNAQYVPRGSTSMLDAIGVAIENLKKDVVETDDTAYLIVLLSDGAENSSKKENWSTIAEKITKLQATGKWTVTTLLSNVDIAQVRQGLNIPAGNIGTFTSTMKGMAAGFGQINNASTAYMSSRSVGACSTSAFYSPDVVDSDVVNLVADDPNNPKPSK
jgi:Mg-chelatase subunit ChlD